MDQNWGTGKLNFWRAGATPVRPVRAIKGKEGQDAKEVKKGAVKEKKTVRFADEDERRKRRGDGDEMRRDQAIYQETVGADIDGERAASADSDRRESRDTGGSSASNEAAPGATSEGQDEEDREEMDEGRTPIAMTVPEGPSINEREEHELTHIPFRSWCEHCVKGRARSKAHRRRNPEIKREELSKVTRVYMDFYYNGIREKEEEREEEKGREGHGTSTG